MCHWPARPSRYHRAPAWMGPVSERRQLTFGLATLVAPTRHLGPAGCAPPPRPSGRRPGPGPVRCATWPIFQDVKHCAPLGIIHARPHGPTWADPGACSAPAALRAAPTSRGAPGAGVRARVATGARYINRPDEQVEPNGCLHVCRVPVPLVCVCAAAAAPLHARPNGSRSQTYPRRALAAAWPARSPRAQPGPVYSGPHLGSCQSGHRFGPR